MEGAFPGDEVRTAITNMEVNGNPFGLAYAARGDWAADLDVPTVEQADDVDHPLLRRLLCLFRQAQPGGGQKLCHDL